MQDEQKAEIWREGYRACEEGVAESRNPYTVLAVANGTRGVLNAPESAFHMLPVEVKRNDNDGYALMRPLQDRPDNAGRTDFYWSLDEFVAVPMPEAAKAEAPKIGDTAYLLGNGGMDDWHGLRVKVVGFKPQWMENEDYYYLEPIDPRPWGNANFHWKARHVVSDIPAPL